MNLLSYRSTLLLLTGLFCLAGPAQAQLFGEVVSRTGTLDDDIYTAGRQVNLDVESNGDIIAAGGQVDIGGRIKGDVLAAGGTVLVRGQLEDDVRVAGGNVTLAGNVGGDAVIAGGNVNVTRETRVADRVWLAGGEINMLGRVGKQLRVAGGNVTVGGEVNGDAYVMAETLTIAPGAVIRGKLVYKSDHEANIDPSARIGGGVTREALPTRGPPDRGEAIGMGLLFYASLALTAIVVWLLFPVFSQQTAQGLRTAPWLSLGLGLAVLATTPLLGILLMVTVVGMPLALLLLPIYLVALFVGLLAAIYFIADVMLARLPTRSSHRGWRLAAILVATLALALVAMIPVIGKLLWLLLWLAGIGALVLSAWRTYRGARSAAVAI